MELADLPKSRRLGRVRRGEFGRAQAPEGKNRQGKSAKSIFLQQMTTAYDLLSRGYFPKELPPPFDTVEFANRVIGSLEPPPASFTNIRATRATASMHNHARVGNLRRRLAIANPIPQFNLCALIEANWERLNRLATASPFSLSRPTDDPRRALVGRGDRRPTLRAHYRSSARFILTTDVARFYASIYTHSIPWAIHGKAKAKRNRKDTLLGNRIDHWIRNGQDGQTMGIPIGPDTSLLIAEILLSAVDKKIKRKLSTVRAFRFIDDYEFAVSSRDNAEIALAAVQEAMSEYELALSPEKTTISPLPCSLDEDWLSPLRDFRFSQGVARQGTELIAYFNKAYSLARESKDKPVLAYAISRLRSVVVQPANWDLFQDLLFQSVLAEPGTLPPVLAHLVRYRDAGFEINTPGLTDVANLQIAYQAPLGHASEVAWALWTVLAFRLAIKPTAAKAISLSSDSVVALLGMDALDQGLVTSGMTTDLWKSYLTTDQLYGQQWLLSYEASVKGWLTGTAGIDHIGADSNFEWLRAIGVEFYDAVQTRPAAEGGTVDQNLASDLDETVDAMVDPYGPEADDELEMPDLSQLLGAEDDDDSTSEDVDF